MFKILFIIFFLISITCLLYWFAITPKTPKLQAPLETRNEFNYKTSLNAQTDPSLPEILYLRRVRDSSWQTSGEHTDYQLNNYQEASMSVSNIKPDAYLRKSPQDPNRILIGRLTDQGSGMHGWHVTMIKQGEQAINFSRHQRYKVWIEKDFPTGFNDDGEPLSDNPQRWYFSGLADIIAEEHYNGYIEPIEGDK